MPYAFLSSPVRGLEEVRAQIHDLELPGGLTIWVDEIDQPRSLTDPSLATLEDLFRLIRESSVFVILLGSDRHGSGVEVGGETAHVSYWEAELFYAVLTGKSVRVFEFDDFRPGEKLAALLPMLRGALPPAAWSGGHSRSGVVAAVHDFLLKHLSLPAGRTAPRGRVLKALVDGFFSLRGADGRGGGAESESLQFMDGSFADPTVVPNETVISELLDEVSALTNEEGRLTRLWIVFRELTGASVNSRHHTDFLPHWNRFYGEWATAGSWYGLHGHPHLSVLPALIEQAKVRDRMRRLASSEWKAENTFYPGGPLASSRYSISGRSGSYRNRRFLLRAALADLNRSLVEGGPDEAGLLAIRGSVYRRLGAIGAAVADYEDVVRRRREEGASDAAVGVALSELGYGHLFQLRFWRGRSLLEEGVRLLSAGNTRPGFLIRALRKLAVAYSLTGHPKKAREKMEAARNLARAHGVLDQIK